MLNQTAEYALRAVLYLAQTGAGRAATVDEIAEAVGIPASYLSKTLQALVRALVLSSVRGRSGGFRLAVAPERLRLSQVVAPFESGVDRHHCLLGRTECSDRTACAAHAAWKQTAEQVSRFFNTTTIAEIQGPVDRIASLRVAAARS